MKDTQVWFRADEEHLEYIAAVKENFSCDNRSQTIRNILKWARENKIGLQAKQA